MPMTERLESLAKAVHPFPFSLARIHMQSSLCSSYGVEPDPDDFTMVWQIIMGHPPIHCYGKTLDEAIERAAEQVK